MKSQPASFLVFFVLFGFFYSQPTIACSCVSERPVCEKFGNSKAVFLGKAISSTRKEFIEDEKGKKIITLTGKVVFEIQETFSGLKEQKRVSVDVGGACGEIFYPGQSYLIYASGENLSGLHTGMCSGNHFLEEAKDDLRFLRNLPPIGSGAKLYGAVTRQGKEKDSEGRIKFVGLDGIKLTVKDSQGVIQTLETDQQGKYEIEGLKPDTYTVKADLPKGYKQGKYKSERQFTVRDRGCADASFWAQPDNHISGRIIEIEGEAPKKVQLVLVDANQENNRLNRQSEVAKVYFDAANEWNKDGRFDFGWTDTLQPGEYLLGVNVTDNPDEDSPYPPTYYPSVKDRAQATILKVDIGTVIEDIVFQLPPRLQKHTIRGVVVWPDGRPVANAEVYLQDESRPDWSINGFQETDVHGSFKLTGYRGFNYEIIAEAEKFPNAPEGKKQEMEADPYKIILTKDVVGVRIILSKEKKTK